MIIDTGEFEFNLEVENEFHDTGGEERLGIFIPGAGSTYLDEDEVAQLRNHLSRVLDWKRQLESPSCRL